MSTRPTISVIIPCFNAADYIRSAVESVLAQTYPIQEFICVDDGSTDGTVSVLESLRKAGASITILKQSNQGASVARNAGLAKVSADYIQFLDADDLLNPNKLEHQAKLVNSRGTKPGLVAGRSRRIYVDEPNQPEEEDQIHSDDWIGLILTRLGITSSNLWNRKSISSLGGWNEKFSRSNDAELTFRLLKAGAHVVRDQAVLTTLRRRSESLSNHDAVASAKAWLQLRREIYDYLQSSGLLTAERKRVLLQTIFYRLHQLAYTEPEYAARMHDELIPPGYIPDDPWLGLGRVYTLAYELFGFTAAENIHKRWLSVRRVFS